MKKKSVYDNSKSSKSNKNLTNLTSDSEKKMKVLDEIVKEQKNFNEDTFKADDSERRPYSPPFTTIKNPSIDNLDDPSAANLDDGSQEIDNSNISCVK